MNIGTPEDVCTREFHRRKVFFKKRNLNMKTGVLVATLYNSEKLKRLQSSGV